MTTRPRFGSLALAVLMAAGLGFTTLETEAQQTGAAGLGSGVSSSGSGTKEKAPTSRRATRNQGAGIQSPDRPAGNAATGTANSGDNRPHTAARAQGGASNAGGRQSIAAPQSERSESPSNKR